MSYSERNDDVVAYIGTSKRSRFAVSRCEPGTFLCDKSHERIYISLHQLGTMQMLKFILEFFAAPEDPLSEGDGR